MCVCVWGGGGGENERDGSGWVNKSCRKGTVVGRG